MDSSSLNRELSITNKNRSDRKNVDVNENTNANIFPEATFTTKEQVPKKISWTAFKSVIIHGQLLLLVRKLYFGEDLQRNSNMSPVTEVESSKYTRVYGRRFWIVFVYTVFSILNNMPWNQYSVITNVTVCYYNVTVFDVNWMAMVYMVVYIILVFPASWFLDRYGLRTTLLIGTSVSTLSALVQCTSLEPDGFGLAMFAQVLASIGQCFMLNLAPKLALVWFAPSEVGKASAAGFIGNPLGAALTSVFVPYVTSNDCSRKDLIRRGKEIVTYTLTSCNLLLLLLAILTFENKPQYPPSHAEGERFESCSYKKSTLALGKNRHFLLLCAGFGLVFGAYYSSATVTNQMLISIYPGHEEDIGMICFVNMIAGLLAYVVAGYVLDMTRKLKEVSMVILGCSFFFMCAFTGFLYIEHIWIIYVVNAGIGFFFSGYFPVGIEFATEITYPEPEGTSAALMCASFMVCGVVMTNVGSFLIEKYGNLSCNLFFCASVLLGWIATSLAKCECRRLKKNMEGAQQKVENK